MCAVNYSAIAPIVLSHIYCYSDSINVWLEVGGIIPVFGNIIFHVTSSVILVQVIYSGIFQNINMSASLPAYKSKPTFNNISM